MEDVTEKRRKEAQLRRAENLASLTTLAAGVAHEIKNPLGSLSIHVQLMRKAIKNSCESSAGTIARYLDVVDEEIDRLNRIVVDFLFAVRPMDIHPRDTDLNALLTELMDFLAPEIERSGVRTELSLSQEVPRLSLDPRYIKQAVLNLAQNALAAMPNGGTLGVRTERKDDEIRLSISDTGVGIPEENLPKIFEPYFTTKDTGTGLGLTLTFKIVKEHGGDIAVVSKSGQGSTFTITLPLPQARAQADSAGGRGGDVDVSVEGEDAVKFSILVADDEKNIREGLAEALRLEGYDVIPVADGQAAPGRRGSRTRGSGRHGPAHAPRLGQ